MSHIPSPGVARLSVVLSAVFLAVLAHPWRSETQRWVLGVAVVVVLVSLAWWRGRHLTTIAGQWLRIVLHRNPIHASEAGVRHAGTDATTTVLLRLVGSDREVPLGLLTSYLNRYGLVCDAMRVTTHSAAGGKTTWIGLTFSAARNLAALQARAPQLPLQHTAEAAARRLIEHLRENGWTATLVDQVPDLVAADAAEHWHSVTDAGGHLTAYVLGDASEQALATVDAAAAAETWTVVEIAGTAALPQIRAGAAIRTQDRPGTAVAGLIPAPGRQAAALAALHPLSAARLIS